MQKNWHVFEKVNFELHDHVSLYPEQIGNSFVNNFISMCTFTNLYCNYFAKYENTIFVSV